MVPFTIKSWKVNEEIKLEFGGISISRAMCHVLFEDFEKEIYKIQHENYISKNEGKLSLSATLPNNEPWETIVEINSEGYSIDEIKSVIKAAHKALLNHFNSISDF